MNRWMWILGVLMVGLAGCVNPQTRAQSAEETEREKDLEVRTIGGVTEVDNVQDIRVNGVGLVTGLNSTGHSPNSTFRTMLEQQLRKQKVPNVKEMLDSSDNCLVLVQAVIPAGTHRGDALDVEVTLPPGSHATSLRGGYLQDCILREYEDKRSLRPQYSGPNQLVSSQILAHARGPLLVGFGNVDDPGEMLRALIWEGGTSGIERPFFLWLKADERYASIAKAIADRLNLMFQDDPRTQRLIQQNQRLSLLDDVTQQLNQKQEHNLGHGEIAKAVNKEMINLRVPYAYRYNAGRYLRVARLMPLREAPDHQGRYRRRLQKMLLDPADTVRAALRLEALGKESVAVLKSGLDSTQPLVRFASAESLAYLGSTAGVDELAKLAEGQAELRMYCLMALASLDEGICRSKLTEMLTMDDPALRCGAFRALRLLDERPARLHADLGGEFVGHSFWLHQVAPKSPRLVYFAMGKRAEIVLFGEGIELSPLKVLAGSEFTVAIEAGDDRCTVSRITSQGSITQRQCTLQLDDVLHTLANLGAGYPEVVDLLRKLDDRQAVNCPITATALPTMLSVEDLAEAGRNPGFLLSPLTTSPSPASRGVE